MALVKDVMKKDVKVAETGTTVLEAVKRMQKFGIGGLVIVKGSEAVGIVTDHDVLFKIVAKEKDSKKVKVEEIMSSPLVTVSPDSELSEASQLMTENKVKKLVVLDSKKTLIGIITATDLLAHGPEFLDVLVNLNLPGGKPTFSA